MKLIVAVLLFAISFSSVGQIDQQKMLVLKKIEKFRKMRNIGLAMAVVGATAGITGMVRIYKGTNCNSTTGQCTSTASDEDVALWLAGAPLFSAGLPIGIIGHSNMKKYERRLMGTGVSLNLQLSPRHQGLVLTYRF
jgi:hypothetical protein